MTKALKAVTPGWPMKVLQEVLRERMMKTLRLALLGQMMRTLEAVPLELLVRKVGGEVQLEWKMKALAALSEDLVAVASHEVLPLKAHL